MTLALKASIQISGNLDMSYFILYFIIWSFWFWEDFDQSKKWRFHFHSQIQLLFKSTFMIELWVWTRYLPVSWHTLLHQATMLINWHIQLMSLSFTVKTKSCAFGKTSMCLWRIVGYSKSFTSRANPGRNLVEKTTDLQAD